MVDFIKKVNSAKLRESDGVLFSEQKKVDSDTLDCFGDSFLVTLWYKETFQCSPLWMPIQDIPTCVDNDYSGLVIGTVKIEPDYDPKQMDISVRCFADEVKLEKKVEYSELMDLKTARMVARNMAPDDKAVAIIKEDHSDGSIYYSVYTLDQEIKPEYEVGNSGLTFYNFAKKGISEKYPISVVEIYSGNKTPLSQSIIDLERPTPFPTVDEPVLCMAKGSVLMYRPADSLEKADKVIGKMITYAYHTVLPLSSDSINKQNLSYRLKGSIDYDSLLGPDKTYGLHPKIGQMTKEDVSYLGYFAGEAKSAESIFRLDVTTLDLLIPEQRAEYLKTIIKSDKSNVDKCIGVLGLFQTIPTKDPLRDYKTETFSVLKILKKDGLLNGLLDVCEDQSRISLLLTLDKLGVPDNTFDVSVSDSLNYFGWGLAKGTVGFVERTKHMLADPLGTFVPMVGLLGQYVVDNLIVGVVGYNNFTKDAFNRKNKFENAISSIWEKYKEGWKVSYRLGAGPVIASDMLGKVTPDVLMTAAFLGGSVEKWSSSIGLLQKSKKMSIISNSIKGYSVSARRWATMLTALPL